MEHKQCTSDDLYHFPYSNQGFLADRFTKSNNLNIPDTIPENCSAELSEDSLKMEAPKFEAENFSCADKENVYNNLQVRCNESTNSSTNISIDNSYIKQCERKLLESSNSENDKIIESDKNEFSKRFLDVQRELLYHNDTISTPPSSLRKEISLLRNEMIEAHEFHDLEIQVLKEEKLNEADSYNYLELFEKYSSLMELYTTLKAEYDDYRKEQEKIRQEYQSKTADCLEFLCSQIEASDNSLNFSSASFISFNGGIKSSTMMEDVSEVEATVINDATVLTNDPLSITNDVIFKTPLQTPLKSASKFEKEMNSSVKKRVLKDEITKHKTAVPLDSECNIQLLNLETALYDKVKEVKDLEQRLFKVEDLSSVLQNEFERITSVYVKENSILKENLAKKTEELNELTLKLFMEITSLKPSLRDSLNDVSGIKLLVIFIETVMESCKEIQNEEIRKHNAEKADWEESRKLELMKIEDLQNQISLNLVEIENFKKMCDDLERKLRDAESAILKRDEEIQMLQLDVSTFKKTQEDFASVRETLSKLESKLNLTETEKKAVENQYQELEAVVENLKSEIAANGKLRLELQAQLLTGEEKKSEIESENIRLKQLYDTLKDQKTEIESTLKSSELEIMVLKENLASADKTVFQLKSQLQSVETEKTDLENRYKEMQENKQHILDEINAKNLENILANEKILNENENLKQKILEKEEILAELKTELEFVKGKQINDFHRIEELTKEKEGLKKESSVFSKTSDAVEESLKNLMDLITDIKSDGDLPNDRIINLIDNLSKFQESTERQEIKLKESNDTLEVQMTEGNIFSQDEDVLNEDIVKSDKSELMVVKANLLSADKTILQLKSQLESVEAEKREVENRCSELQESNQSLRVEISTAKKLENNPAYEKIQIENDDLKQRIFEFNKTIEEYKNELELVKKNRRNNILKVEELIREIEELKKENIDFSHAFTTIEETQKNLEDVLLDVEGVSDLTSDRIINLISQSSKTSDPETKQNIIVTNLFETIKKTYKEVQNEWLKKLDSKVTEWESQKDVDMQKFQEQIEQMQTELNEKNIQYETAMKQAKDSLAVADDTILQLKSQLTSIQNEKTELEIHRRKLEEDRLILQGEIDTKETIVKELDELKIVWRKIEIENGDLKERILESDKVIEECKSELELAEKNRMKNMSKVEELIREIEELKKENIDFSHAFTTIEETQKNLEDVLSSVGHGGCLTSDQIINLISQNSKLSDSETKPNKIVTDLFETIKKTYKEVQNEWLKKLDSKATEWESQKDVDMQKFQEQIEQMQTELNEKNIQYETAMKQAKDSLAVADDTILQLKSQLTSIQSEKTELENHRRKLEEDRLILQGEIDTKETIVKELDELKIVWRKIEIENGDLKERILESDKVIEKCKSELELAEKDRRNNILKVEELIREIDELKKENIDFSHAFTTIEETEKNLEDVLSSVGHGGCLTSDQIINLISQNSKLSDSETKPNKIVTDLFETIKKTYKEVQNEWLKKLDSKATELESQKDVDMQKFQEQIEQMQTELNEKNIQYETAMKQAKDSLAVADDTILQLKSQLTSIQNEKTELENHRRKLEEERLILQGEIDTKETIVKELDELKIVWRKIEIENGDLKKQTLESEEVIVRLKSCLEIRKEEQSRNEIKMHELQSEIDLLKKEREELTSLSGKLESIEKNNKNLLNVLLDIQSHLNMPEDTLTKLMSGDFENKKIFSEKINSFVKTQLEGLKAENKHLKFGIDNMKQKVKQLNKLICETADNGMKEEISNLNNSHPYSMSLRSKSKNMDIYVRRLDRLEEINHNLTELLTRILNITEFPDLEKLKLCSARDFSGIMKKLVAHFKDLVSKMKELKEENAQLDEECETYANIIKDLKKENAAVWKSNKEKTEAMESVINQLNEEKNCLEKEKQDLLGKIAKFEGESQKLKSTSKIEEPFHNCICGNESKKINELKRAILVKEQKLLELQELEAQTNSYKSQIEYLKTALEREKKKVGEEKEKNKKLQNEQNESTKNQKAENKKTDENQILDELRMRGSISGGIVQEFVDKEKMRKLSKDIGILKELCRARYAEIKRLEAVNAALRNGTPKNSNQMDSPLRSKGYNTRSKNQVRTLWQTEISGKENGSL